MESPTPEPRIQISPMTLENVKAVEALERECFTNPWSLDSLVEELSNPLAVFYVAEAAAEGGEAEVIGYVGMHHIIDEGYITNVAVTGAYRRRGIASLLMKALLDYADRNELQMLTLEARPSNRAALALYSSFDFEQTGERKAYYTHPSEDALILTRKV